MARRFVRAIRDWFARRRQPRTPIPELTYPLAECGPDNQHWCGITGCCLYQCYDRDWD